MSDTTQAIRASSTKNLAAFKAKALAHYMAMSGRPMMECEALYDAIRAILAPMVRIAMAMPIHSLGVFVGSGRLPQQQSDLESKAMNALGVEGVIIPISIKDGPGAGECVVEFGGLSEGFVVCGGVDRLINPARPDYEPDAKAACVCMDDMIEAKVASIVMSMGPPDASGIEVALQNILDDAREYGRCDVVMLAPPRREDVVAIKASSEAHVDAIRRLVDATGRLAPVYLMGRNESFRIIDPFSSVDDEPAKFQPSIAQQHFVVGDPVVMKRAISNPTSSGTITDISNGRVTVEWSDGERAIFDMAEALMRLSSAPVREEMSPSGVVYSTPGMRDDAIEALSSIGIDPVSVYAMASHCRPVSETALGWREKLLDSMAGMGLQGAFVSGFTEEGDAFAPREWFESRLPNGDRLVVDLSHKDIRIMVGEADEYVVATDLPSIQ